MNSPSATIYPCLVIALEEKQTTHQNAPISASAHQKNDRPISEQGFETRVRLLSLETQVVVLRNGRYTGPFETTRSQDLQHYCGMTPIIILA
jgi:hypothetical protein